MENQEQGTQIKIETYQKMTELELDSLRRENFSLKVVIAQLQQDLAEARKLSLDKNAPEAVKLSGPTQQPLPQTPSVGDPSKVKIEGTI